MGVDKEVGEAADEAVSEMSMGMDEQVGEAGEATGKAGMDEDEVRGVDVAEEA